MDHRYEGNVLEEKGVINFTSAGNISGMLKINGEENVHVYQNPPIPPGYKHISGEKYRMWTIERECDKTQAFWLPMEALEANGTLDGENFNQKFGRRFETDGGKEHHKELLNGEIFDQFISYRRYGGIYIFKYPISIDPQTNKPQSVKTEDSLYTCTDDFAYASKIARVIDTRDDGSVKTHLLYGAECDSLHQWLKMSGVKLDESWELHQKWTQEEYHNGTISGGEWKEIIDKVVRGAGNIGVRDRAYSRKHMIPVAMTIL